ncbi:MAG: hypothetical protein IMZ62_00435 [Chloroflexi bacterium]|nr:hypothetical protein [Chloroflexota bacterium]
MDGELDRAMHHWALNRSILMTPFHNRALIAADTTEAEVDYQPKVFREAAQALFGTFCMGGWYPPDKASTLELEAKCLTQNPITPRSGASACGPGR